MLCTLIHGLCKFFLVMPYETSLNSLIHEPTFINSILSPLVAKVNIVKKLGDIAAHEEIKDFLIKML